MTVPQQMITPVPYKLTFQTDLSRELQTYIRQAFSQGVCQQQQPSIDLSNASRQEIVAAQNRPDNAKASLAKYLCILRNFEVKMVTFQASFQWQDALDKKKKVTDKTIAFEKAGIIWNLASALTHESINADTPDVRVKIFKYAAGWLERLVNHVHQSQLPQNLTDLNEGVITFFKSLVIAQQKEAFCQMTSMNPNFAPAVPGLYLDAVAQYQNCIELLSTSILKGNQFLSNRLLYGQRFCLASSQVFQAVALKKALKYGQDVAYEESAIKIFEECEKIISVKQLGTYQNKDNFGFVFGTTEKQREWLVSEISRLKHLAQEDRHACTNTYYRAVPALTECEAPKRKEITIQPVQDDELERVTGVFIAPSGPNTPPTNGQPLLPIPLFASLMPQDIVRYSDEFRRDTEPIIGRLYSEGDRIKALRASTIEQQGVNGSLAQANNIINNTSPALLSQPAVQGAILIRTKGGFDYLQNAYNTVLEMRNSDRQKLQQLSQVIQAAFNNPSLTSPYQTPQQSTMIRSLQQLQAEGTTYDDSINQATKIDDSVYAKLNDIKPVINAVFATPFTPTDVNSTRGLIGAIIAATTTTSLTASIQSLVPTSNLTQQIAEKLPLLNGALGTYQQAEDAYYKELDQLRGVVCSINISVLLTNRGERPIQKIIEDEKAKITSRVEPLAARNAACVKLLQDVDGHHRQLKVLLDQTNQATAVDKVNSKLIATAESYTSIETHLTRGVGFYNMLKDRIFDYNTRISVIVNSLPTAGAGGGGVNPYGFGN